MRVLIINPIVYTAETKEIAKVSSIKDSMIYDLCLAFHNNGHKVVLCAAEPYKPDFDEKYPFEIIWSKCILPKVFAPHRFPLLSDVRKYIKKYYSEIDLIITGEVFSLNSLIAYRMAPEKTIVWHELALHNRMCKKVPSKVWYNIIAPVFMRSAFVVPRSEEAKRFIGKYCKNVSEQVIDHGVNLAKFDFCSSKKNYFVVCSQLIPRKRIDGIIEKFSCYLKKYDAETVLYIAGSGESEQLLRDKVAELNVESKVVFTGKLSHKELKPLLSEASALLINTIQDNSMISIVEAIAVGTPVVTTDVPLNSEYIIKYKLGIAKPQWDEEDLQEICMNNSVYVKNCDDYKEKLSTDFRVKQFIDAAGKMSINRG